MSGKSRVEVDCDVSGLGWGKFKPLLTDVIIARLEPLQRRYYELAKHPDFIHDVLADGSERAAAVADQTLKEVREVMGFVLPRGR